MSPWQVTVAAPSAEEAEALGRGAVEARLAACAQVSGPVRSTYRWRGEVATATEWICTLKTADDRLTSLVELLRSRHSYEVPEIVATALGAGDGDYLAWIDTETRSG